MRVLITGGCGFIGSHLVEHHLNQGDDVWAVDDLSSGSLDNIKPFQQNAKFKFDKASLVNWKSLKEAVDWAERIYHMAAVVGVFRVLSEPVNVMQTNTICCEHLFEAVIKSKSQPLVIFASTSSVYGHSETMSEDAPLVINYVANPLKSYAVSKMASEVIAQGYHQVKQLPVIIIRFFNMIGPRQTGRYGMVVPRFVQQACNNEALTIFGNGKQSRSFCDIRDAVAAIMLLINSPNTLGQIFNLGNDREISINDLANLVRQRANSQSTTTLIPYEQAYGGEFTDIKHRRPDIRKLISLTGFKHQWTLEKTIDDLINIYRNK